ncbi:hypothetical protein OOU_Y34scaffold01011g2 [Pyricularia oryzae Y34]|uniref:Uncharacterized protein n=2 Tax=Pyricularia oryzae TaxID=318829 RepID=A0AA97NMH6_PYRO3|nr:hypothetical protein OOU_Y34scaffold01011g2 [Pyricularia oryzae Y34]
MTHEQAKISITAGVIWVDGKGRVVSPGSRQQGPNIFIAQNQRRSTLDGDRFEERHHHECNYYTVHAVDPISPPTATDVPPRRPRAAHPPSPEQPTYRDGAAMYRRPQHFLICGT